jgi:mycothiol synthase
MAQLVMFRPPGAAEPSVNAVPVRRASDSDAPELARLLGEAFPEQKWSVERARKDLLEAPDVSQVLVIEEQGELIATASVRYHQGFPDSGYVHWVGVDPRARGRRLATVVMADVLRAFAADGRASAILETDDPRLPAIASYLGQGFIPHYTEPDHPLRWSRVFEAMAQHRKHPKGN